MLKFTIRMLAARTKHKQYSLVEKYENFGRYDTKTKKKKRI